MRFNIEGDQRELIVIIALTQLNFLYSHSCPSRIYSNFVPDRFKHYNPRF
jgi:hypothetical protein